MAHDTSYQSEYLNVTFISDTQKIFVAKIFLNAIIPSQEKLTPYYMETMHINNLRKGLLQVLSKQNLS